MATSVIRIRINIISSDPSDFTYTFNIDPCSLQQVRRELMNGEDNLHGLFSTHDGYYQFSDYTDGCVTESLMRVKEELLTPKLLEAINSLQFETPQNSCKL